MRHFAGTEIVIPTGRNSFCCVVPCALMLGVYSAGSAGAALIVWRLMRMRSRRRGADSP